MRFFFIDLVDRTFLDGSWGWGLFLFLNCFGLAHLSRKWKHRLRAMDKLAVEEHKRRWHQGLANEECLGYFVWLGVWLFVAEASKRGVFRCSLDKPIF